MYTNGMCKICTNHTNFFKKADFKNYLFYFFKKYIIIYFKLHRVYMLNTAI